MFDIIIVVVIELNLMKVGIIICFSSWSVLEQCLVLNRSSINTYCVNIITIRKLS